MFLLGKKNTALLITLVVFMFSLYFVLPKDMISIHKILIYSISVLLVIAYMYKTHSVLLSLKPNNKIEDWKFAALLIFLLFIFALVNTDFFMSNNHSILFIGYIFLVAFLQTLYEEIIFRGILVNHYIKKGFNINKVIFYSSAIFGLFHVTSFLKSFDISSAINQIVFSFLMGIFFVLIYLKFKNIYYNAILHMLINIPSYIKRKSVDTTSIDFENLNLNQFNFVDSLISLGGVVIIYSPLLLISLIIYKQLNKRFNPNLEMIYKEEPFYIFNKLTSEKKVQ